MRMSIATFGVAAVMAATAPALAGTVSFMQQVSGSTGSLTGDDVNFEIPDFNPSLGMLTGLSVTFTGTVTDKVVFGGTGGPGAPPPAGTYTAVNNSFVAGGGFPFMYYNLAASTFTLPANARSATSTTASVQYTAVLNSSGLSQYDTGLPPHYETTGLEFGFKLYDSQGNMVGDADDDSMFNVSAVETYTYTPVPEPASLALAFSGLLALSGLRFRRS